MLSECGYPQGFPAPGHRSTCRDSARLQGAGSLCGGVMSTRVCRQLGCCNTAPPPRPSQGLRKTAANIPTWRHLEPAHQEHGKSARAAKSVAPRRRGKRGGPGQREQGVRASEVEPAAPGARVQKFPGAAARAPAPPRGRCTKLRALGPGAPGRGTGMEGKGRGGRSRQRRGISR